MKIIYCPCKDKSEAKSIAKNLLDKKLIACANIIPSDSLYFWKGQLTEETESILLCKTTKEKAKLAADEIKKLHSYEIPAIIIIDAEANKEFEEWVRKVNFIHESVFH